MSIVNYINKCFFLENFLYNNYSTLLNGIKGIKDMNKGNYFIRFTCKICENKMERLFSKHAYEKGIVLIKCDKCNNIHLIADNIGWFNDGLGKRNIEDILKEKKEKYVKKDIKGIIELIKKDLNTKI